MSNNNEEWREMLLHRLNCPSKHAGEQTLNKRHPKRAAGAGRGGVFEAET
jgi:hypothetical protein